MPPTSPRSAFAYPRKSRPAGPPWIFLSFGRHRHDHRYALAVFDICVAVKTDEVAFFEKNADENITRGRDCKQQVPEGHDRRSPECQQETEIDWMPDKSVEQGRPETW